MSVLTTAQKALYDVLVAKLLLAPVSMGTITTGTAQPISFTDALFTGLSAGGRASGSTGTLGVVSTTFASSGAETGTSATQGGLGSAASSTQPYNATDFVGGRFHCTLKKANNEPLVLSDVLSTAAAGFPASVAAPVFLYLANRSDLGADAHWRGWFYFRNQATGTLTPVTPDTSVATVSLDIPQVFASKDVPTSAQYVQVGSLGSAEVVFGAIGDITPPQTAKAAGATGKAVDAGHAHGPPTADVPFAGFGITGARDPVAAQEYATKNYQDVKINHFGNWGQLGSNAATAVRFLDFGNVRDATHTTEESSAQVMSVSGTVTKLLCKHFSALSTDTVTYTLRVNSVDTAVTCTVAAGALAANDTAHSASFAIGDSLSIKSVQSSTQSNAALGASVSLGYKSP